MVSISPIDCFWYIFYRRLKGRPARGCCLCSAASAPSSPPALRRLAAAAAAAAAAPCGPTERGGLLRRSGPRRPHAHCRRRPSVRSSSCGCARATTARWTKGPLGRTLQGWAGDDDGGSRSRQFLAAPQRAWPAPLPDDAWPGRLAATRPVHWSAA
eukprot:SAG31_NODE_6184_length_2105_cov_4.906542_2_plen_156_part_00